MLFDKHELLFTYNSSVNFLNLLKFEIILKINLAFFSFIHLNYTLVIHPFLYYEYSLFSNKLINKLFTFLI